MSSDLNHQRSNPAIIFVIALFERPRWWSSSILVWPRSNSSVVIQINYWFRRCGIFSTFNILLWSSIGVSQLDLFQQRIQSQDDVRSCPFFWTRLTCKFHPTSKVWINWRVVYILTTAYTKYVSYITINNFSSTAKL